MTALQFHKDLQFDITSLFHTFLHNEKATSNTKPYEFAKEYRKLCDEVAIRFGTMYAHPSTQN